MINHHCSIRVPARSGERRVQAKGIFTGAKVLRGSDWSYGDQDGNYDVNIVSHSHLSRE